MSPNLHNAPARRLERSCRRPDWIRSAPPRQGLERIEAFFSGHAYDPHRHDTYAIGVTLTGVQSFRYRGAPAHSLPGNVMVLHPDEVHDGHAGSEDGFSYRMLYIEPRLIMAALAGHARSLPFVASPVLSDAHLRKAVTLALDELDHDMEDLETDSFVLALSEALAVLDPSSGSPRLSASCARAIDHARQFLDAQSGETVTSEELESITGLDRFTLARQFRARLGTSPYRYLVQRRLERAKSLILAGHALVETAQAAGFADQSHMTRQFKKAYGLSPGRWRGLHAELSQ